VSSRGDGVDPLRAEDLLHEVLKLPAPERHAAVDRLCGGDDRLRREVLSLLAHLPDPEVESEEGQDSEETPLEGRVIGGCRLESLIGRGGAGRVYAAWQDWPPRKVAIKILRPELLSESARRRFRRETRALARLDHPGMARILSAGLHGDPGLELPYVVMELVEPGTPITAWWSNSTRTLAERLDRFASLCDAVHHGHTRGLVHRDLKPSNVLVNGSDDLKVIDFGVASITADDGSQATLTRAVAGTPGYMAPEQFQGDGETDLRTDVHGLGLLLFECLAGRPAYARPGMHLAAAARSITADPPPSLLPLRPDLDRDLVTVVEHAIAKDPADRYQSASEMAADLRRYLGGRPILARPTPTWRRVQLFARRNPSATAAVLVASLALMLAFGVREQAAADRAEAALASTQAALRRSWIAELTRAIEVEDSTGVRQTRENLADDQSWPIRLLDALSDESEGSVRQSHDARFANFAAMGCDVSPDGGTLAFCGDWDYGAVLVDARTMALLRILGPATRAWAITFDRAQGRLLMADKRELLVWERPWQGEPRHVPLPFPGGTGIAASPDGKQVVVACDGQAAVLEIDSGRVLATTAKSPGLTTRVDWSPDGRWIAMGVEPESIRILHAPTLQEAFRIRAPRQRSQAIAFDPSSRFVAFGGDMRVLHVSPVDGSGPVRQLPMDFSIWGIDWHPDGDRIAVADRGKGVRLVGVPRDGGPPTLLGSYRGNNSEVWDVDWAPNGSRLFSAGQVEVHAWEPMPRRGPHRTELGSPGLALTHLPDGRGAALTGDGSLWLMPADPRQPAERQWQVPDFEASSAAADPAHDQWAWVSTTGQLVVASPGQARETRVQLEGFVDPPARTAFSPDGRRVAVMGRNRDEPLLVVDIAAGQVQARMPGPWPSVPTGLMWLDDRNLVAGTFSGATFLREEAPGRWVHDHGTGGAWVSPIPAGKDRVIYGSMSGEVIEVRLPLGDQVRTYSGVTDIPLCFALSPDGERLAASGSDRRLHVFDRASREQLLSISGHGPGRRVIGASFSPDGERVLTLDTGGTVLHWVPRPSGRWTPKFPPPP
jgi:WD40 repeat protein/tRNA A-37 threonylcarbamoyl transferase component Bud32